MSNNIEQIRVGTVDYVLGVQSDWNQTDETAPDYIKNKPEIPTDVGGGGGVGQQIEGGGEIFNIGQKGGGGFARSNTASGSASHAEGSATTASGVTSHAEGDETKASAYCAHAEGRHTNATGQFSHAEGEGTTASGVRAHAEGQSTQAKGSNAHAEGCSSVAEGIDSHAEGSDTVARGMRSHAEGFYTIAASAQQHAQGKFNIEDADGVFAHIVGNGTGSSARSNAHTLDWDGNAWYAGTVEGTAMIVKSSTEGSTKRFKITVDDSGAISATEITA